jgi:type I restriction enzyme M protein
MDLKDNIESTAFRLLNHIRSEPTIGFSLVMSILFVKKMCSSVKTKFESPDKRRWEKVFESKNRLKELVSILSDIENCNQDLDGLTRLLQRDSVRILNNGRIVDHVLEEIRSIDVTDQEFLIVLVKQLLNSYDELVGIRGGSGATPESIKKIAAGIYSFRNFEVYDPCIGISGFSEVDPRKIKKIVGQETNEYTALLSKIVHFLLGFENVEIQVSNSLIDPIRTEDGRLRKFDYVFADPPFGVRLDHSNYENFGFDRETFLFDTTDSNWLFAQRVLASLKENAEGAILISLGSLATQAGLNARRGFVLDKKIKAIVQLPSQLLTVTTIPCALLVLSKAPVAKGILFVKADSMGTIKGKLRTLDSDEIQKVISALKLREEIYGFSKLVSFSEIEANDFILTPQKYVSADRKMSNLNISDLNLKIEDARLSAERASQKFFKTIEELNG